MVKILLLVIATFLAVLGYVFLYISNKEKLRSYKLILFLGAGFAVASILGNYYFQSSESALNQSKLIEINEQASLIRDQNKLLLSQNDSLKIQMGKIIKTNQEITRSLEPFEEIARTKYPALNDQEALNRLVSDISKMQPKIVFLQNKTQQYRDPSTNLLHTVYPFRSQYPTGVRDIHIKLRFDGPFISATPGIGGAIAEEYGTQMRIDPDSSGFYYTTGYLREGNDIFIHVLSRKSLKVDSMSLSP
jgi:hypothetical protein